MQSNVRGTTVSSPEIAGNYVGWVPFIAPPWIAEALGATPIVMTLSPVAVVSYIAPYNMILDGGNLTVSTTNTAYTFAVKLYVNGGSYRAIASFSSGTFTTSNVSMSSSVAFNTQVQIKPGDVITFIINLVTGPEVAVDSTTFVPYGRISM
jgi:hypothetical protein